MENSFQVLSKQQQSLMAKILSEAFQQHDNFVYLIENEEKRKKSGYLLFQFMTKVMNKYGYIYVVYNNNVPIGYVTFMDDKKAKLGVRTVLGANALFLAARFWISLSLKERRKYRNYLNSYNKLNHKKTNQIHLYYTGVLDEFRGKGIMKKAMDEALSYFQKNAYNSVCLETSDNSNVGLYKHLGYQITQSILTKDERQEIFFFEKDF